MSSGARSGLSLGIRARTTLTAALVVGIATGLVLLGVVLTARAALVDEVGDTTTARAQDITLLAEHGPVPASLPGLREDLLVQVIDASGTVIASSRTLGDQKTPMVPISLMPGESRSFSALDVADAGADESAGEATSDPEERFQIAAAGVMTTGGPVTVIVAKSLDPVEKLMQVLAPRLGIGLPLLMAVVGLTVWTITGWALRPVEAIRLQAEEVSASSLEQRVPVPPARDEIGRLATTVNHMLDRLEASAIAQRRFVADASHELKSPVASIHTMLDVARQSAPEDLPALLDDLTLEDSRLEQLLADLLTLARFDERSMHADVSDVDLDDVAFREARSASRSPSVAVDVSGVHAVRVCADESSIESVVRNLMENAERHANSTVWLAVRQEGREAVLTVSDDGPGIAPENRERVFERFVRLDESRTRGDGGTGLGLSVCRALARSAGGDVRVIEPLHGGTTFEVRLPLRNPSDAPCA